jgi:hypothetical protein
LLDVPTAQILNIFGVMRPSAGNWVGLPGWQTVTAAVSPVVVLAVNKELIPNAETEEEILLLIDRAATDWDENKYFAIDRGGQVVVDWFSSAPTETILGQLVLVLRPKRMLSVSNQDALWQNEE